jgi:hypothetical protein
MAKVSRSTSGAKFLANKDKFDATQFADFNVNHKPAGGRAERLAMKQRLAEAKALMTAPKEVVSVGYVKCNLKFAYAV